jgi:hypothetical protein
MMVPERGFRGYGGRLRGFGSILTTGTAAGAESPADVLKAIAPGSQPVTNIEQLAAGRGSFIFLESQNVPLTVGILGFTSGSSKGVTTTIFYTYGPEAGKVAFHNATDLLAPGWRIVDKSRSEAAYRAGVVTAMPSVPAPSMEPLGASMEKALSLVDEAMALVSAKEYDAAAPKIASAKEVLSDAGWHLGFMLDTGHVDRPTFGSIKKTIDAIAAANSALEKANLNRTGDVDALVAQAKNDVESAFMLVAKDTVRQSETYAKRSENIRNMRLRTKELLALSQPFRGDPKIAPLINLLELDSAILDDAVSKMDVDENAITAALESPSVDGFRGLGQAGGVLSAIGRFFLRMWRRPMTLKQAKEMAGFAGKLMSPAQLKALAKQGTPTWFRMLVGQGGKGAAFIIAHILPMWYFFAPNSPLHKNAAAEAEKRSLAYQIASQRFHELLAQGVATKDALIKMKEYMVEIEKQLEVDIKSYPELTTLDPQTALARAAIQAKAKQVVDANAAAAVGDKGTSPIVWILGAGAVALILYLIISGKKEVPVARLAKPAKR